MTSLFDSYRPPQGPKLRDKKARRAARRSGDGGREEQMVPKVSFDSYYGTPVVKAPPWESPIGIYLFLGGVAGGSSLLGFGAQLTGKKILRRNARLTAFGAASVGAAALIADLGRPERLLNMFRVFKLSSPMSIGSWILGGFSATAGLAAVAELDHLTKQAVPLPSWLRRTVHVVLAPAAGAAAAILGSPLAVYTAVLLGDTSNPVWNEIKGQLPYVFVSSASVASSGAAMVLTPVAEAGPARVLARIGAVCDIATTQVMEKKADPAIQDALHAKRHGLMLKLSETCVIAGGIVSLFAKKSRKAAVIAGSALMAGSALTRFGILEAGLESVHDPRYVIEPQKRRLAKREAKEGTAHSIATAG